jgi:RNA polymerase sigma-70 factor (ECF subfamily)
VLAVVYLIFNGATPAAATSTRRRCGSAAARRADARRAEVHALLALMLLHDARREARFADGELVLLETRTGAVGR